MSLLYFLNRSKLKNKSVFIDGLYYKLDHSTNTATVADRKELNRHDGSCILGDVVIPEEITYLRKTFLVTAIGPGAFRDWTGMTSLVIPDTVVSIGERAFESCVSMVSIAIPKSVNRIGKWAFAWCTALESVILPEQITVIESYLFSSCKKLKSINTLGLVTKIGAGAFYNCNSLISVVVLDSVITIGYSAFFDCCGMESITLGKSVSLIEKGAISNCPKLKTIKVHPENKTYASDGIALFNKDKTVLYKLPCAIADYEIPDTVTTIRQYAISNCLNLISLRLPKTITQIEDIAITSSITQNLYLTWDVPIKINKNINVLSTVDTIHVPVGTKELYLASGWNISNHIVDE